MDVKRELNVVPNETRLLHNSCNTSVAYIGIHLDRTLSYKGHMYTKTKMKVDARKNTSSKLANSKWGCRASTKRTIIIGLALCYSANEYARPVWARTRKQGPTSSAAGFVMDLAPEELITVTVREGRRLPGSGNTLCQGHERRTCNATPI